MPEHILTLLQSPLYSYYIFVVLTIVPVIRIFERAGFRPWWALLLSVPIVGFILCMIVLALQFGWTWKISRNLVRCVVFVLLAAAGFFTQIDMPPLWLQHLIKGPIILFGLAASGVALTKMGKSPYLALFLLLPYVQIFVVWYMAFSAWPGQVQDRYRS